MPDEVTQRLWQITEDEMLPAVDRADCAAFGDAVYRFGRLAGECFAAVQGGPFASREIGRLIDAIRDYGVRGVGQSSWGPTVFAICSSPSDAEALVQSTAQSGPSSTVQFGNCDSVQRGSANRRTGRLTGPGSVVEHMSILLNQSLTGATNVERVGRPLSCSEGERLAMRLVLQQMNDGVGQGLQIVRRHENCTVARRGKDFARAADVGRDDRQAARRRFQQHTPQRFLPGGVDQQRALGQKLVHVVAAAQKVDAAGERRFRRQSNAAAVRIRAIPACRTSARRR